MTEEAPMSPELQVVADWVSAVVNREIDYPQLKDKYVEWASKYEEHMNLWGYRAPQVAAAQAEKYLGTNKDAKILDVCAGTGFIGKVLKEAGFKTIDHLDGNEGMRAEAVKKAVYRHYYQYYIGHEKFEEIRDNNYDAIWFVGALCDGHVKEDCLDLGFREMIRITKPGGYFYGAIIEGCLHEPYKTNIEAVMDGMVAEGLWKWVDKGIVVDGEHREQIWVLQIC